MTVPFITLTSYHYAKVMDWLATLIADLRGAAVKVLLRIAKCTFGFRKWEDVIALSQFEAWCGINHTTAIATVDDLLTLRLIRRVRAGKGYCYAINIPENLFVEKSTEVFHTEPEAVSFFTQNQGTYPQNPEASVGKSDIQITNVTGNKWKEQEVEDLLATFDDINARNAKPIRFLARWVARARTLGMSWSDLYTLWRACQRVGRNPVALFLSRLMGDGTLPTARKERPHAAPPPANPIYAEFRALLQGGAA